MDSVMLPALAALAGSAVGGLTSLAAAWITQNRQAASLEIEEERRRRQDLYKLFIEDAAKLYADSLACTEAEVQSFVRVYAHLSKMRVISSQSTVDAAEATLRAIVDNFQAPNRSVREVEEMFADPEIIDLLRDFSDAAREELRTMRLR